MKKALAGGSIILGVIAGGGCFAFDWDYGGGGAGGGGAGGSSETAGGMPTGGGGGGRTLLRTLFFGEGKRLEPHYYDYGDGAVQLIDWYDTKLGINCTFTTFSSTEIACVPQTADGSTFYADAACTQQLINFGSNGCPLPHYGQVNDNGHPHCFTPTSNGRPGTGGPSTIHGAGADFTGATVYRNNGTACVGSAPVGTFKYLGDSVSVDATFVVATIEKEKRGELLDELVLKGSDGSWQLFRPNDAQGQCILRDVGGTGVCVSIYTGFEVGIPLYTDASCTMPLSSDVGFVYTDVCKPPEYIRRNDTGSDNCPLPMRFYAAGDRSTAPLVWADNAGVCNAYTQVNVDAIEVGKEIKAEDLPTAATQTIGSGRLRGSFYGTSPTEPLGMPFTFTDETGAACRPYRLDGDQSARCIDASYPLASYFADAACTEPAVIYFAPSCPPVDPPKYALRPSKHATGCETTQLVAGMNRLGASTSKAYFFNAGVCTETAFGAATAYTLGAEVSTASLPKMDEILR